MYTDFIRMSTTREGVLRLIKKLLGKRIKEYRERSGYTQDALAEVLSLTNNYISYIERGKKFPRIENLVAIMNAIGASADQIFCDVIDKTYPTRVSILSDEIEDLSSEEQQRIFAVVETLIKESKDKS